MEIKVLIVDDEEQILRLLSNALEETGYKIDTINDPFKAMEMIENTNYHIVITDVAMPGMTGIELIKRIKEYNGMIQVIMVTGHITTTNVLEALRSGAVDFYFKPFENIYMVVKSVEQIVERLVHWNSEMAKIMKDIDGV